MSTTDSTTEQIDAKRLKQREYQRQYILRIKQRLIKRLGGKCVDCKSPFDLEFDHKYGATWQRRKMWSGARLKKYEEEIEQGLIELRCSDCNKRRGRPQPQPSEDEIGDGEGVPF